MTVYRRDRAPIVESRCGRCCRVFNAFTGTLLHGTRQRPGELVRMIGELVRKASASRTVCTVGAESESSGESSVTEPCPEGRPAGESPSAEEPVSPATEVEHDLPATDVRRPGQRRKRPQSRKLFRLRRTPVARLRNILS